MIRESGVEHDPVEFFFDLPAILWCLLKFHWPERYSIHIGGYDKICHRECKKCGYVHKWMAWR